MARLISLSIFVLIVCGCATLSAKRLDVEGVGGDLWIKRIGSGSQMAVGRRTFEREGVGFQENGLLGATSVKIRQVSGSLYIDEVLTGTQGVPLPASLRHLYVPGDPLTIGEGK